ncbi:MAG: DUF559 domain-containing protein [Chloroflexi bacterium]|nr:MAG: DUF559 domain-containing protein [Chloroflexota bacterium]
MAMPANIPTGLRSGPFRGSDSVRSGLLTRNQLRSGAWRRLFDDVYVQHSLPLTHLARCRAVALLLPPGAAVSGASAACLHGADVVGAEAPVEVTSPRERRLPNRPGVLARYSDLRADDIVVCAGIPTTSPVRTAFDVARRCDEVQAIVAVDAVLHACSVRPAAITAYANDGRTSWHGVHRVPAVLAQAASGAESPMETRLRLVLTRSGLPMPILQHRVRDERRTVVARLDLAYVESRLGIEYDGGDHWTPTAVRRDLRRQNALRALGWSLLRFTADDVLHNPTRLLAQVEAARLTPAGGAVPARSPPLASAAQPPSSPGFVGAVAAVSVAWTTRRCRYVPRWRSHAPAHVISVSEGGPSRVNSESVEESYGTMLLASVTNVTVEPSARVTLIWSPFRIRPRYQKTAGPLVQSRWPAITASPTSPGAEPRRYHATLLACEGVAIRPCPSTPTGSTGAMARAWASCWSGVGDAAGAGREAAAGDVATGASRHGRYGGP